MDILQAVSEEEREAKRAASLRRPDELVHDEEGLIRGEPKACKDIVGGPLCRL